MMAAPATRATYLDKERKIRDGIRGQIGAYDQNLRSRKGYVEPSFAAFWLNYAKASGGPHER